MTIVSIIIPAYNEEKMLPATLQNLNTIIAQVDAQIEVIVVDNNSNDNTADIATKFSCKVVLEKINQISKARNSGAKVAKGKYLIFLDADTILPLSVLTQTISNLQKGDCCGGGAEMILDNTQSCLANKSIQIWNFISRHKKVVAGCFTYCLRKAWLESGGYNEKIYASEDLHFSRVLKKWGVTNNKMIKIINEPKVITSARKMKQPVRVMITMLTFMIFPFAGRWKILCHLWYKR